MDITNHSRTAATKWLAGFAIVFYAFLLIRILITLLFEFADLISSCIAIALYGLPVSAILFVLIRFFKSETYHRTTTIAFTIFAGIHFLFIPFSLVMLSMHSFFNQRGLHNSNAIAWTVLTLNTVMLLIMLILRQGSKPISD